MRISIGRQLLFSTVREGKDRGRGPRAEASVPGESESSETDKERRRKVK